MVSLVSSHLLKSKNPIRVSRTYNNSLRRTSKKIVDDRVVYAARINNYSRKNHRPTGTFVGEQYCFIRARQTTAYIDGIKSESRRPTTVILLLLLLCSQPWSRRQGPAGGTSYFSRNNVWYTRPGYAVIYHQTRGDRVVRSSCFVYRGGKTSKSSPKSSTRWRNAPLIVELCATVTPLHGYYPPTAPRPDAAGPSGGARCDGALI